MAFRSDFVDVVTPLGERLKLYDGARSPTDQPKNDAADPAKAVPQSFIDAMIVREEVYVKEQKVLLENELDSDDPRSFHWVAYASIPAKDASSEPVGEQSGTGRRKTSTSTKIPIGTIRIVVPPHDAHPNGKWGTDVHDENEPYVKIGRLAVIKEFRKAGISRLLIETALAYVREHPHEMLPQADPSKMEALNQGLHNGVGLDFRGLVLAHSQTGVQKVWVRYGFETDESMGVWDEEGIDHVGMWKRMDVSSGRRKSRVV